jgi:crotonobetainyl-CoA:carnitine CoA-transferase CaiB-like acyl-CoA transferase
MQPDTEPSAAAEPTSDARPLDGVAVVELCQWVAGPAAAGIMADWGADVVKVEAPAGDPQRRIFAAVGIERDLPNPAFAQDNRGKRSIVLDLATPDGRERLEQLLARADVFVTNLRPDALDRLGLDPAAVSERHPTLVVAALSGYGSDGPARNVPGYDVGAFLARSGLARTNSPKGEPPLFLRSGVGDHVTGMAMAMATMAALYERTRTGRGRVVETSLFTTGMYAVSWDLSVQLTFDRLSSLRPRERVQTPMVNSYRSADDRWFYLIGLEAGRHFPNLAAAIDRPDLIDDERFATASGIFANAEALIGILDEVFAGRAMADLAEQFERHDVWWAPCQSMADVAADPQAHAMGAFIPTPDNARRADDAPRDDAAQDDAAQEEASPAVRTVASPARFDGAVYSPRRPVPRLGEHTAEVLAELDQPRGSAADRASGDRASGDQTSDDQAPGGQASGDQASDKW